jgi:hypothetical protein
MGQSLDGKSIQYYGFFCQEKGENFVSLYEFLYNYAEYSRDLAARAGN